MGIRRIVGQASTPRFSPEAIEWARRKQAEKGHPVWIAPNTGSDSGNYSGYPETLETTIAPTLDTTLAPTELSTTLLGTTAQPTVTEEEDENWVTAATNVWNDPVQLDAETIKRFHGPIVYRDIKPGLVDLPAPFTPRPHEDDPDYENILDNTGYLVPNPVITPQQALGQLGPRPTTTPEDMRQEIGVNPIRGLIGQYMMNALGGRAESALRTLRNFQQPNQEGYMTASSTTSTHAPSYGISPVFSPTITYAPVTISLGADLLPQLTDARGGGA